MLLHRCHRDNAFSRRLSTEMIEQIKLFPFAYGLGLLA